MTTYLHPMRVGDRVALAPHTDLWMAGVRFGEVQSIQPGMIEDIYVLHHDEGQTIGAVTKSDLLGTVARAQVCPTCGNSGNAVDFMTSHTCYTAPPVCDGLPLGQTTCPDKAGHM